MSHLILLQCFLLFALCSGHSLVAVSGAIRAVISVVSDVWVAGDVFSELSLIMNPDCRADASRQRFFSL